MYTFELHLKVSGNTKNNVSSLWFILKIKSKKNVAKIKNLKIFNFTNSKFMGLGYGKQTIIEGFPYKYFNIIASTVLLQLKIYIGISRGIS